ncbi:hypothetical protein SLEP1_g8171 [Rubroshorea leprosula]|uniref:CTLH domain-containing protein n=1 Tax=Rubroshorea leprosula TaxID=152421 RepID=A0AAV5IBU3_9ROSI|nr:hypothetical protein SLEP1_g8171 [Rubroshorea leprosula]
MRLDISTLDELVHEYCVYRGIVDSGLASPSGRQTVSETLKANQVEPGYCSSRNSSFEVDCNEAKQLDVETFMSNAKFDGSPENNTDVTSQQVGDAEVRYACESAIKIEGCSTSESHQPGNSTYLKNKAHGTGERNKRKRWRGRHDEFGGTPDVSCMGCSKEERSATSTTGINISKERQGVKNLDREDKYQIVLGIKELTSEGMAAEVVEEINTMDPKFFLQNPILLFQLKQVEFLKLVSSGDHSGALRVACSHLGPLVAKDLALLKPLKETLLALLQPNEDALRRGMPLHALATSIQVAVGKKIGIDEPLLMRIMRATLHTHTEWFKLQMYKDRFEKLLRIDLLKENNVAFLVSDATLKSNVDGCNLGSSQVTLSSSTWTSEDGSNPNQSFSIDVCDENAILKVMEFLDLPRADAIYLLAQYNGNAEIVIQQLFA